MLSFNKLINAICLTAILAVPGQSWCETGLPPEVSQEIAKKYPEAVIERFEKKQGNTTSSYMVEVEIGEKHLVVELDENGKILDDREDDELPVIGGTLSVGLGVTSETAIYKGADDELRCDPALIYHNQRFHLQAYDGINISYDLYQETPFSIGAYGELFTDGFEASDSNYLLGMDETDMVFAAGFTARYVSEIGFFELKLVNDVTARHDGHQGELTYAFRFDFLGAEITPSVSLTYMSADTTDYYYGVSTAESRANRPTYSPDSAVNISVKVLGLYPLTTSLSLVGIIDTTWLDSTIEDSPIVDSGNEFSATFGLLYTF